jgi:hypothetical protein
MAKKNWTSSSPILPRPLGNTKTRAWILQPGRPPTPFKGDKKKLARLILARLLETVSPMTDNLSEELATLAASLRNAPSSEKIPAFSLEKPFSVSPSPLPPPTTATPIAPPNHFVDDPSLSNAQRLTHLREHIGDCQRCPLGARASNWLSALAIPRRVFSSSGKVPATPKIARENLSSDRRDNCTGQDPHGHRSF